MVVLEFSTNNSLWRNPYSVLSSDASPLALPGKGVICLFSKIKPRHEECTTLLHQLPREDTFLFATLVMGNVFTEHSWEKRSQLCRHTCSHNESQKPDLMATKEENDVRKLMMLGS